MNAQLPDVSQTEVSTEAIPLQWVGMQHIDLPILIDEADYRRTLHARADAQVDLPVPQIKGIHMSRLHLLLDELADKEALTPASLQKLLQAMIDSHRDCKSRNARVRLCFDLLARRPALVSENLGGWKSYPVQLDAKLIDGAFTLQLQLTVTYSSTCPCSAALARQLVEQGFQQAFAGQEQIASSDIAAWIRQNASLATPHSQRSEADIAIDISPSAPDLGLLALVDHVEHALGTPVQTAVKRADEQAFAALNGQNLMFVEDSARRLKAALDAGYANARIHVRHLESLHAHDAVAWAGPTGDEQDS